MFIEQEFHSDGARWYDSNYSTVSPLRPDSNPGSFSIGLNGTWYDRRTAEGGDIIELIAKRDGISAKAAALYILGEHEEGDTPLLARDDASEAPADAAPEGSLAPEPVPAPVVQQRPQAKAEELKLSWLPIPEGKFPPLKWTPDYLTLYHVKGVPAYYVVRYNAKGNGENKKNIYPMYWTGSKFQSGLTDDLKKARVLYQFDREKTVVVVEGEAKRQDAEEKYPQYAWTCWHGGAGIVKHLDLADLQGCDVIVWPDFDEPGALAADYICAKSQSLVAKLRRIVPPEGKPRGWDVADAIREGMDVPAFLEAANELVEEDKQEAIQTLTEPRASIGRALTDLGNAERFVDMWGHVLRYNVDKGRWLVWDKIRWKDDDQTLINAMVKRTVRTIPLVESDKEAYPFAMKSESARGVNALLSLAKNEPGIPISEPSLDAQPFLMCCPNGVVDLATGDLLEPRQDWLCYKITNTNYNPRASCPMFMQFLEETFSEDPGIINFVQRWLGYSLTADVSAQTFAVFYGLGANGKSTLVETIQRIAGDYVKTAPPDTFIQKQAGGIPNDIAALRGARMVLTTETEANARLAEAKVKSMTGGDRMSARWMRGEYFDFSPTWKITISTNHRPRISGGDYGIWRRIVLVPFNNIVSPARQDTQLMAKLLTEAEGILAWVVKGAAAWYQSGRGRVGLQVPEVVFAETQEYREDEDVIGRFISMGCHTGEEVQGMVKSGKLLRHGTACTQVYFSFKAWIEEQGETVYANMSQSAFGRAMRERGFISERTSTERFYPLVVPREQYFRRSEQDRGFHRYDRVDA